jgi:exopolysaccharide biosynthesis predicted pyruvyltransferase EpsI
VASKEELYWSEVSEYVKSEGLGIRAVSSSGYYPAMNLIPEVDNEQLTIPEWISAIRNSNGVLTTSFHGTVFSILFHKPFVVIPLQNEYSSGNSRLTSFLGDLGLSDRILTNGNSVESIFNTAIDWEKVDSLVESKRQESAQFLFDALK